MAAHVGLGGKKNAPEPLPRPGENARGAPSNRSAGPSEESLRRRIRHRSPRHKALSFDASRLPSSTTAKAYGSVRQETTTGRYKHAKDFGVNDPWGKNAAANYQSALEAHVRDPGTQMFNGTYRGDPVIHYLNPSTGLNAVTDTSRNFFPVAAQSGPDQQRPNTRQPVTNDKYALRQVKEPSLCLKPRWPS